MYHALYCEKIPPKGKRNVFLYSLEFLLLFVQAKSKRIHVYADINFAVSTERSQQEFYLLSNFLFGPEQDAIFYFDQKISLIYLFITFKIIKDAPH